MTFLLLAAALAPAADPTLKVGDPAPPLAADRWYGGPAVTRFEPGRVYVVEFWATWCPSCLTYAPYLADLARELRPQGVTVIGHTTKDVRGNTPAAVQRYAERKGAKLGYPLALADTDATRGAWMTAAGQAGIPTCFVVGKDGRLAFIGQPASLPAVLPKVLAGTWEPARDGPPLAEAETEAEALDTAMKADDADPKALLPRLETFAAKNPLLAADPYLTGGRLKLLAKAGRADEAVTLADSLIAGAVRRDESATLGQVRAALADPAGDPKLRAVAVKAAEAERTMLGADDPGATVRLAAAYKAAGDGRARTLAADGAKLAEAAFALDPDNWRLLLLLAQAHQTAGDLPAAKAAGDRAVATAGRLGASDAVKAFVAKEAAKYAK